MIDQGRQAAAGSGWWFPLETQQQELARLRLKARQEDDAAQGAAAKRISLPDALELRPADSGPDMYALLREAKLRAEIDSLHRFLWCVAQQQGGVLSVTDAEMAECPEHAVLVASRENDALRVAAQP